MSQNSWWQGAVIYQIYPRSFQDSNADGVGDLPGIIERLEYVASLAVDAIWISPFFKSPMADFGYDIADYLAVDPLFGDMADFDQLLAKAHQLNLKVMIDQVLSHTSIEHLWFQESRQNKTNAKADWYVWADAKPDGSPPNNWMSIFGGVAWTWDARRCQYYLHNFLSQQPDLNFHNPDVRAAVKANVKFWLDKGVDGFRLDAINFCFHDQQLRDNPAKPLERRVGRGFSPDNPYAFQYHYFNNTQPENLTFLEELRHLLNGYSGVVALGEISSEDSLATMAQYTTDTRLHLGYSFELLTDEFNATYIRETVENLERQLPHGWPCWSISNHDVVRVATRWGGMDVPKTLPAMLTALVCSLRGAVCVYQGEELGLPEADVAFEDLQDPYGKAFWPNFKGRDGCRTPMPWDASAHAGFSQAKPWLPVPDAHRNLAVTQQEADPDSVLQQYRQFMQWRKTQAALCWGSIRFIQSNPQLLCLVRDYQGQRVLAVFNLSNQSQQLYVPELTQATLLHGHGLLSGTLDTEGLHVPAYGVCFAQLV